MMSLDAFELSLDKTIASLDVDVGFLLMAGLDNRRIDTDFYAFRARYLRALCNENELERVIARSQVRGYRELHKQFKVDNSKLVPSPESLYSIVFKHGDLRAINPLVDVYNYVALKTGLSCGAHDIDHLANGIRLAPTGGLPSFRALGSAKEQTLPANEYAYFDGNGRVICRLECRQAEHSAVTEASQNVAIIVQGNSRTPRPLIASALGEIENLVARYISPSSTSRREILPCESSDIGELQSHAV
jgi:DNA/RNA-binding domain of Phe-tRNA-synthetase-like protein